MDSKSWNELWQDDTSLLLWSEPDTDVVDLLPRLQEEKVVRILDLGCGIGRHVVFFAKSGFEVCGIDAATAGIEHCRSWLEAEGLTAELGYSDIKGIGATDEVFDFVVSWNVIYHGTLAELKTALAEIHRVLRPGGLLYLTLNSTLNKHCGVGTEVEPMTFDNPKKWDGEHLHHFSDSTEVRSLFSNWTIESMKENEEIVSGRHFAESWHWMVLVRKASHNE